MAVTIISQPDNETSGGGNLNTLSNGFTFVLTSDNLAEDNFKYLIYIYVDGELIGTKKLPSTGTNTTVNLYETIKPYVKPAFQINGTDIWNIDDIEKDDENPSIIELEVEIGDQYSISSGLILSALLTRNYVTTRGYSTDGDTMGDIFEDDSVVRHVRGEPHVIYANNVENTVSGFATLSYEYYDESGTVISLGNDSSGSISISEKERIIYFPIGDNAITPIPSNAKKAQFAVIGASGLMTTTLNVNIYDACNDNPITLMFLNRYFQWSFFTFDAKNSETLEKTGQRWESESEGLQDFDIITRSKMTLTSTYILEEEAECLKDLLMSEHIFITSTAERVVIEDNSMMIKKNDREGVINYTFNIQKSNRLFKP